MSIEPNTSGHISVDDGLRLAYRIWHAAEPRGGVLVVHGFAEHGLRYGNLLDVLVPAGLSVMTCDLAGHGASGGRRGHVDSFDDYLDELASLMDLAREQLPDPLMIVAHSMGGLIATRFCQTRSLKAAALVLSNPALSVKVPVPAWKTAAAKGLSRFLPHLRLPAGVPPELISRDPAVVQAYIADPLVFSDGSARWGAEFLGAQDLCVRAPGQFTFAPTLVQIGTGDGIIDPVVGAEFFNSVASKGCRVQTYADCYHELYNEPVAMRAPILADARDFLLAHAAPASATA